MSDNSTAMEKARLYDELVAQGKAPSLEEVEAKRAKEAEAARAAEEKAAQAAANPPPQQEPERDHRRERHSR